MQRQDNVTQGDVMKNYDKQWFSARTAARYCDYRTSRQIYAAIRDGSLPAVNRGGRGGFRIHRDHLDSWLTGQNMDNDNEYNKHK